MASVEVDIVLRTVNEVAVVLLVEEAEAVPAMAVSHLQDRVGTVVVPIAVLIARWPNLRQRPLRKCGLHRQ